MDKFEFSDLYKFLVSAGIVLIGLSVVLPWLYLREPFDLLIEREKLATLTQTAQVLIQSRQNLVAIIYYVIPWVSVILFMIGTGSVIFGLFKWFKKQSILDSKELLDLRMLKKKLGKMTAGEIDEKSSREYEKISEEEDQVEEAIPTKQIFLKDYEKIEAILIDKITLIYSSRYSILPH